MMFFACTALIGCVTATGRVANANGDPSWTVQPTLEWDDVAECMSGYRDARDPDEETWYLDGLKNLRQAGAQVDEQWVWLVAYHGSAFWRGGADKRYQPEASKQVRLLERMERLGVCVSPGTLNNAVCNRSMDEHPEILRVILRMNPDLEVRYQGTGYFAKQATILHAAAANGSAKICKALLDFGADPTALNSDGQTPLQWADTCFDQPCYPHIHSARNHGDKLRDTLQPAEDRWRAKHRARQHLLHVLDSTREWLEQTERRPFL